MLRSPSSSARDTAETTPSIRKRSRQSGAVDQLPCDGGNKRWKRTCKTISFILTASLKLFLLTVVICRCLFPSISSVLLVCPNLSLGHATNYYFLLRIRSRGFQRQLKRYSGNSKTVPSELNFAISTCASTKLPSGQALVVLPEPFKSTLSKSLYHSQVD